MKTTLLFLLLTIPAFAQNGFKTEKGKIVWERFFPESGADIKSIIEAQEKMKVLNADEASFIGKAEAVKNDIYANSVRLESDANFDFAVTKVKGGYTVKVTNYVFLEKYGPSQVRILPGSLEKYYIEYGKIRNSAKTQSDLGYIDGFLTGLFLPQPAENAVPAAPATATTATTLGVPAVAAAK